MSIAEKSNELKELVSTYDTQWFLGDLSKLIHAIAADRANDQLGKLSSPMRQLYFLAGLLVTSDPSKGVDIMFSHEKWKQIVSLLNEIEFEYDKLFFPEKPEEVDSQWKHIRKVAMPSFLSYFNQGPLNYEEQSINWTIQLYGQMDKIVFAEIGLITNDFIQFYENLDRVQRNNFQSYTVKHSELRPNWNEYTKIVMGVSDDVPEFIKEMGEKNRPLYTYMSDHGIIDRFYPKEIVTESLSLEKVEKILAHITTSRKQTDFIYYTSTKPSNPLYEKPIVDIGDGMFQVFEVKQVIHAIEKLLERVCTKTVENVTSYIEKKGRLLENVIVKLFTKFFKTDFRVFQGYYVDGFEQDILFIWKKYAFIIEAKGYNIREPLRDPDKAFIRIKDDFNSSIGYGYSQTRRVEKKFIFGQPLIVTDKYGKVIEELDTNEFENDFSIIVNLESFGQIQNDLSTLIVLEYDDDVYPWVVKFDDLEIFLLTLMARHKTPIEFVNYLLFREELHGKLICSDELEVCGGYVLKRLTKKVIANKDIILTTPELADVFDQQYHKGMGFDGEKLFVEKKSGNYVFW